jgi:16S rRNA (cytosine967-C5)-methyltransferase
LLKVNVSDVPTSGQNVREVATDILVKIETRKAYSDILLDSALRCPGISRRDGALLSELTYGTLRWRGRIDAHLQVLIRRPLCKTDPFLRNLLRIAIYQISFLDRIPDYAAVNAAVVIAKLHGGGQAAGFVNAVLRRYLREQPERKLPKPDSERAEVSALAEYWSHPQWLIEKWRDYVGEGEITALLEANNEEPPLVLRANKLRTTREDLIRIFEREGIDAVATRWSPQGVRVRSKAPIEQLPGFSEGIFQVQGEASQLVSYLLRPEPGERVLDACAAPGGKTTHIAELMQDRGKIVGGDISPRGLRKLEENAQRLGLSSIRTLLVDSGKANRDDARPYDRILVDAPCSGLGTLRSHPEIKWNRAEADIKRLTQIQQRILRNAAARLKLGGVLVYSSCTLTPDENEQIVHQFLGNSEHFVLEDAAAYLPEGAQELARDRCLLAWPHRHDTDGFFAARLRRVEA